MKTQPNSPTPGYAFDCPNCGHSQRAMPSLFMQMGINSGGGKCLECKIYLHLEVDTKSEENRMIATTFEEWSKTVKKITDSNLQKE